jgi:hypothetical protein
MAEDLRTQASDHPPAWANDRLLAFDERRHEAVGTFVHTETWCDRESINVFEVVGTRNGSYYGWSWARFLEEGKRMRRNLALYTSNPGYYRGTEQKLPIMSFITYDGRQLYVDGDGNHRTCIARFAFELDGRTHLHGVTLEHHEVDWAMMHAFCDIEQTITYRRLPYTVKALREAAGREDAAGWKRDSFKPFILLTHLRGSGQEHRLDLQAAQAWLQHYQRPALLRWAGRLWRPAV